MNSNVENEKNESLKDALNHIEINLLMEEIKKLKIKN